ETEPGDGLQSVEDRGLNELVLDPPLENMPNSVNASVDRAACQAGLDHLLPYGFEGKGAKVGDPRSGIKRGQWANGEANLLLLFGAMVRFGKPQKRGQQLCDSQVGRAATRQRAVASYPLGDQPVVFEPACGGVVFSKIEVSPP